MIRFLALWVIIAAICVTAITCLAMLTSVTPNAGEEVVLIDKPLTPWADEGVRREPVKTGRTWIWRTTQAVTVDVLPQQYPITINDFMSSDGIPLDFNASLRLQITDSVAMVTQFGEDWYRNNIHATFEEAVRTELKKHTMHAAAIDGSASESIDQNVTKAMESYIKDRKIPAALLTVTLGKANPPPGVLAQREETAKEEQRKVTELKRKISEMNRKGAEEARAAADNAYRNKMDLTPEQFVELERIKMMNTVCTSKQGCTFISGIASPIIGTR